MLTAPEVTEEVQCRRWLHPMASLTKTPLRRQAEGLGLVNGITVNPVDHHVGWQVDILLSIWTGLPMGGEDGNIRS